MSISALILAAASVLIAVVIWLCGAGVIRRNPIVGLRLPALFASDDAWKAGHRAGVLPTIAAAVICVILTIVVAVSPTTFGAVGDGIILAVLVAGVVVATILGNRAAYRSIESTVQG